MLFKKITNPKTGRKVNIYSKLGKNILKNYVNQLGGHNGPCAFNESTSRCKKGTKWDHNTCELSEKGRCKKKVLKQEITDEIVLETENLDIQVDEENLVDIIKNFAPEEYSNPNYMNKTLAEIKKIKYDPDYISQFDGNPINIVTTAKRFSQYLEMSESDLLNDPFTHSEALKDQILDKMGDETFWDDLIE